MDLNSINYQVFFKHNKGSQKIVAYSDITIKEKSTITGDLNLMVLHLTNAAFCRNNTAFFLTLVELL